MGPDHDGHNMRHPDSLDNGSDSMSYIHDQTNEKEVTRHKLFECLMCSRQSIFADRDPDNVADTCQPTDRGYYICSNCMIPKIYN